MLANFTINSNQDQYMNRNLQDSSKQCQKQQHPNEDILMICLDNNCRQNCLCCCSCIDDEHQMHEVISLRKFQMILKDRLQKNSKNKQKGVIVNMLQQKRKQFIEEVRQLESCFTAKINKLQQEINRIFSEVIQSLTIPGHDEIVEYLTENYNSKLWGKIFEDLEVCDKYKIGTFKDTQAILNYQFCLFENKISQTESQLDKMLTDLQKHVQSVNFNSKRYEQSLKFHDYYRYFDMSRLDNQCFIQKKKSNGNRTAALGNRPLDPINNTVKFNIIKNGDGVPSICIGAAILSVVKRNNFTNCTGSKRGVYCIDQASTSNWGSIQPSNQATYWNHDTQNPNSTIGFQFTEGDTVTMTVDFQQGIIIFEMGQEIFDMEIDCSHQDLYPFVCMNNSNSVVQLIQ